jgi:hypothetical protein
MKTYTHIVLTLLFIRPYNIKSVYIIDTFPNQNKSWSFGTLLGKYENIFDQFNDTECRLYPKGKYIPLTN